jgi:ADP-heptose:LPS heptosyltransferase
MEKTSTLVLAAGSLGDSLLTLPALKFLQSRSPVTVAGTQPYLDLGADLLGVHKVQPLEPILQKLLAEGGAEPSLEDFPAGFGEVFVFFKDRDENLARRLSQAGCPSAHFPKIPFEAFLKQARWAAEYWLETAGGEGLPADSPFRKASLALPENLKARGGEILRKMGLGPPLVIHPGSGSPGKNAPLSFFRTAAERAGAESGRQVLVVWGEAEGKNVESIREAFQGLEKARVLPEPLPLRDLAALLSVSAAYLGNDSGVTQLASACGLRTFAVFNSTDERVWGPQEAVILAAMKSIYTEK